MVTWMTEAKDEDQSDRSSLRASGALNTAGAQCVNAKGCKTLATKFALVGRELRTIVKEGRTYFEVRRWSECFTVSSVADLHGLLRQFEAAAE